MLANLKGLFAPQAVAQSLKTLPPLESTIMDTYFKQRPTHPLPMLGISELKGVVQVPVTAAELNDLRLMLGNTASLEAWRTRKVDQIRNTIHAITEGMSTVTLTTGKVAWPVQLPGGRMETYGIDYGAPLVHELSAKLTASSKLSEVYRLLRAMQQKIRMAGIGGKVEFVCGEDVTAVFLDMAENYKSTVQDAPVSIKLGDGQVRVGAYVIRFMDETYPDPVSGKWVPKLGPKVLMAVAVDVPGIIWYCAIDSISAKNAAVPLHIVPVERDDDTGITLIGQAKPLPARPSRATCLCTAVA